MRLKNLKYKQDISECFLSVVYYIGGHKNYLKKLLILNSMFERLFHWTCNRCNLHKTKREYGFPKGWVYLPTKFNKRNEIEHLCLHCKRIVPRAEWLNEGEIRKFK